jgi:hypothetical protein
MSPAEFEALKNRRDRLYPRNYPEIVADVWPDPESLASLINQIIDAQAADKRLLYDMPLENRQAVAARIRLYESMLEALDEHRHPVPTND